MNDEKTLEIEQRLELGFAMESLAKASYSLWNNEVLKCAKQAKKHIDTFLGEVSPAPVISEEVADLSSYLHTCLRKYDQSKVSVIIYNLISESRGMGVWLSFCDGLVKNDGSWEAAINEAERASSKYDSTDNYIMCAALHIWRDSGNEFIKEHKNNKKI